MKYLLMDVGSTNIKWCLCDTETGGLSARKRIAFPQRLPEGGKYIFEVDAEAVWSCTEGILEEATRRCPLEGILLSVQMHGYLLADDRFHFLTPYRSWRDRRALLKAGEESYYERFRREYPRSVPPESGSSCKPNLSVCSLYADSFLHPALAERARHYFTLGSYLIFRMTGHNVTHLTDAAASGFYLAQTGQVNEALAQLPPFRLLQFPAACAGLPLAGFWKGVPVYPAVGDQQVAVLGCRLRPREILLNLGTAAQLCVRSEQFLKGKYESRPYFGGQWLCTFSGLCGGAQIRRLADSTPQAALAARLAANYQEALERLPPGERLVITGGAATHYAALIRKACDLLPLPYLILDGSDTLCGLQTLTEFVQKEEPSHDNGKRWEGPLRPYDQRGTLPPFANHPSQRRL